MFAFLLLQSKSDTFGDIEVRAFKSNPRTVVVNSIDELTNLLYSTGASSGSINSIIKKVKFVRKCGVILHSCNYGSPPTEEIQARVQRVGEDRAAFKDLLDNYILKLAHRAAYVISITNNNNGSFTVNLTHAESGAFFSLGDKYDSLFEFYFQIKDALGQNNAFYDANKVDQYYNEIEDKFRPFIKQFY